MTSDSADFELDYLKNRINRFHLNQRLGIEEHREAWVLGQGTNLFHIENWYSVHGLIRGTLRVLNLRARGQRNALNIQTRQLDVHIPGLHENFAGFTLLHLSDLHLDINPDMPSALRQAVENLSYDLCVMTGDYRAKTWGDSTATIDGLTAVRPALNGDIYAVLGNHDSIRMVPHMENLDLIVLVNENTCLERGDARLYLAGIDDPHYYRSDNMEIACDGIQTGHPSILLSHSPEMYKHAAFAEFDLMLCGHTHGGQICLPGGTPLMVNANCPRKMCRGLWQFDRMQGYTSVGSGASVVDVRFNCPPEVTLIRLLPADEIPANAGVA